MGLLEDRLKNNNVAAQNIQNMPPQNIIQQNTVPIQDNIQQVNNTVQNNTNNDILQNRLNTNNTVGKTNNYVEQNINDNDYSEEMLEAYVLRDNREKARRERNTVIKNKLGSFFLSLLCGYILFLIYGVAMTNYQYNDEGIIEPQIMSVSDIKASKSFNIIKVQYENLRYLYEKVLMLDYRLSQNVEDPLNLAPEYEELLDEVENLSIKIDALSVDTRYTTIKAMMLTWVKDDIAIYLQKISSSISQNNMDDANIAIAYKNISYNDFSIITQNVVVLGDNITGMDMTDIRNWSPESYIDEQINGVK